MENFTRIIPKIIVVLLISGVVCAMNTDICYRWLSLQVCSPKSYYHDVVSRQLKGCVASAEKIYVPLKKRLISTGKPRKNICRLEPGDTLKALSGNMGLDSASLIVEGNGMAYLFSLMGDAGKYLPQTEDLSVLLDKYPQFILGQEVTVTRSRTQVQAISVSSVLGLQHLILGKPVIKFARI